MLEIAKCILYGFIFFTLMMVFSGIMEYKMPIKNIENLPNNDLGEISYEIDNDI